MKDSYSQFSFSHNLMRVDNLRCTRCDQEKPESEFSKGTDPKRKFNWWCRSCWKEHNQENRYRERERCVRGCGSGAFLSKEGVCRRCLASEGWRECTACGKKQLYPLMFFSSGSQCKECLKKKQQQYRKENREKFNTNSRKYRKRHPEKRRENHLKSKFNLSLEQERQLLEAQGGGCAICGERPANKSLDIDHDHITGAIRGMLCNKHNQALGLFKDNPAHLRRAADYLDGLVVRAALIFRNR